MTVTQFILAVYALLIFGLVLPLPSGVRTALFMALIVVTAMTLVGGGAQYALSLVQ